VTTVATDRSASVRLILTGLSAGGCVDALAAAFRAAGIANPRLDARVLVAHALGITSADLLARPERSVTADGLGMITGLAAERLARRPVSRILGSREFWGRRFAVSPATLDPRPETETLIAAALELIAAQAPGDRPVRILDLGTGTGAILLTLLAELPRATGLGVDICTGALAVAEANAAALGLADRARFQLSDWADAVTGSFDIVVANPPYIESAVIATLDPEVAHHDPRLALDGGADGLDAYRRMMRSLTARGLASAVAVEVGAGQADAVAAIMTSAFGLPADRARRWLDLAGHGRIVAVAGHPVNHYKKEIGNGGCCD
jgi:release factor glutamine methyltransferase